MLEMSLITAILQLYSQVTDLFGNLNIQRINTRRFDSLARLHYMLNLPRTAIFHGCKNCNFQMKNRDNFLIFAQNIYCGYTLEPPPEAVLTNTHNQCFRAKIRN